MDLWNKTTTTQDTWSQLFVPISSGEPVVFIQHCIQASIQEWTGKSKILGINFYILVQMIKLWLKYVKVWHQIFAIYNIPPL